MINCVIASVNENPIIKPEYFIRKLEFVVILFNKVL